MATHREGDVLTHGDRVEQRRVLEEKTDLAPHAGEFRSCLRADLLTLDEDAPGVRPHQADDVPQRDALAGATSPRITKACAFRDLERHVLQHAPVAERLGDVIQPYRGFIGRMGRGEIRAVDFGSGRHQPPACGNAKKISRTRIT